MLWTIFVILLVLWLLGHGEFAYAGWLHLPLLAIALVVLVIRVFQGHRAV